MIEVLYCTFRGLEGRSFLQPTHGWEYGVVEVTADSFIQALSRKNGRFVFCYCDCVNDAGDILNPSSVLGLKGAPSFFSILFNFSSLIATSIEHMAFKG
jgi:hypothetical protein